MAKSISGDLVHFDQATFNAWLIWVDRELQDLIGFSLSDLETDCPFHVWYQQGLDARSAARLALEECQIEGC